MLIITASCVEDMTLTVIHATTQPGGRLAALMAPSASRRTRYHNAARARNGVTSARNAH